jgi:hypothetical protein
MAELRRGRGIGGRVDPARVDVKRNCAGLLGWVCVRLWMCDRRSKDRELNVIRLHKVIVLQKEICLCFHDYCRTIWSPIVCSAV